MFAMIRVIIAARLQNEGDFLNRLLSGGGNFIKNSSSCKNTPRSSRRLKKHRSKTFVGEGWIRIESLTIPFVPIPPSVSRKYSTLTYVPKYFIRWPVPTVYSSRV